MRDQQPAGMEQRSIWTPFNIVTGAILLMGLLDLGRLYYAYVAVTDASAQGAAYGAANPDDVDGIRTSASDATGGFVQITEDQVTVEPSEITDTVRVTVVYSFTVVTPLVNRMVPEGVIPLRATTDEAVLTGVIE